VSARQPGHTVCEGSCGKLILGWISMVVVPAAATSVSRTYTVARVYIIDNSCVKASGGGGLMMTYCSDICLYALGKPKACPLSYVLCPNRDLPLPLTIGQTAHRLTLGADFPPLVKPL
jgi:hypothetical protein